MGKFKEGERFRLANSLQFGVVLNNNCDTTYECMMSDYHYIKLHESEMFKVWKWSNIQQEIERKIEQMMELPTWKMAVLLAVGAVIASALGFIHALIIIG